jgi:hypothetical protein
MVFSKVAIRLFDRKFSEGKNTAQFKSSMIGKIKPINSGKKQKRKAKKFLNPSRDEESVFLKVEFA